MNVYQSIVNTMTYSNLGLAHHFTEKPFMGEPIGDSPHKGTVMRKAFPCHDVIMLSDSENNRLIQIRCGILRVGVIASMRKEGRLQNIRQMAFEIHMWTGDVWNAASMLAELGFPAKEVCQMSHILGSC